MSTVAIAWVLVATMYNTLEGTAFDGILFGLGIAVAIWRTVDWIGEKL